MGVRCHSALRPHIHATPDINMGTVRIGVLGTPIYLKSCLKLKSVGNRIIVVGIRLRGKLDMNVKLGSCPKKI